MMEKKTEKLDGFQRKYLRGLAQKLKPVAFIGQKGIRTASYASFCFHIYGLTASQKV